MDQRLQLEGILASQRTAPETLCQGRWLPIRRVLLDRPKVLSPKISAEILIR